jgi:hypothetical protein
MGQDLPPYKYKGQQPIEGIQHIKNTIFYLFSFVLAFSIYYLLFLLRLYVDRGLSRWPADPRATLRAPAPTGSFPGERSLVHHRSTSGKTALTGS